MKNINILIKHLESHLEKTIEVDEDGIEYFNEDLVIPACDLNDLNILLTEAKKELASKRNERIWELFKDMVLKYPEISTSDLLKTAKEDCEAFEEFEK